MSEGQIKGVTFMFAVFILQVSIHIDRVKILKGLKI